MKLNKILTGLLVGAFVFGTLPAVSDACRIEDNKDSKAYRIEDNKDSKAYRIEDNKK